MPVILREDEWDTWLNAPAEQAMRLQTALLDDELQIVTRGAEKSDHVSGYHGASDEF